MQQPLGPGLPMHERRASSQSMQSDMGNQNMNRNFMPPNGRGRGYPTPPYGTGPMPSPGMGYRQMSNSRPGPQGMQAGQFQQMPPGSPFNRGRNSPAVAHAQPNMQQQYVPGNQQMGYPGHPQMNPQQYQVRELFSSFSCSRCEHQAGVWRHGGWAAAGREAAAFQQSSMTNPGLFRTLRINVP